MVHSAPRLSVLGRHHTSEGLYDQLRGGVESFDTNEKGWSVRGEKKGFHCMRELSRRWSLVFLRLLDFCMSSIRSLGALKKGADPWH